MPIFKYEVETIQRHTGVGRLVGKPPLRESSTGATAASMTTASKNLAGQHFRMGLTLRCEVLANLLSMNQMKLGTFWLHRGPIENQITPYSHLTCAGP
jgi:hypothetical protein